MDILKQFDEKINGTLKTLLKHAAEQFYMGDRSRNSDIHFGMGLYITDLVVKQHNGELSLGNSGEMGGAEVIIKSPC